MSRPENLRTFYKDLQQLYMTVETSTDGQAEILGIDEMTVRVALKPKTGYNAHAVFTMTIQGQGAYPRVAPKVTFNSPIFHPNIDAKMGYICLSLLNEWYSCWSLLDVVKAMLYLIEHPNFESANNSYAYVNDISELEVKTKRLLAGLKVNEWVFPANEAWCEWARENHCLPTEEEEEEEKESESPMPSTSKATENDELAGVDNETPLPKAEEIDQHQDDKYSIVSSETAPSFAKIRYSVDLDEQSYEKYTQMYVSIETSSQRVVIWNPTGKEGVYKKTIFYFLETLCDSHHNEELGNLSSYLYSGVKLRENQLNPDTCQTSSSCCWYPVYTNETDYSYVYNEEYEPSLDLEYLFKPYEPRVGPGLTGDFCSWALEDGLGSMNILGGLFFEGGRLNADSECFLFEDDDSYQGSDGFRHLFNFEKLEEYEECDEDDDATAVDTLKMETESEATVNDAEEEEVSEEVIEVEIHVSKNVDRDDAQSISSTSTDTYNEEYRDYRLMRECTYCNYHDSDSACWANSNLDPQFIWHLRRTRWSMRFAPQQSVNLSMEGIKVPPWRVSTARLLSDICQYCKANDWAENVALLDPMGLSPLSPVLNLMRHKSGPIPRLDGILWLTPFDAISPFYHVPIPSVQGEEIDYPPAISLRVLTIGAFAANWVSWLSRIETSASLGITRLSTNLYGKALAAYVLQPLSLGCGQAPLLELWPLWLLRSVLKASLSLSKLSFLFGSRNCDLNFFFPFSDLDEI
nr:tubby [Hymenolepis microstoma]